MPTRPSKLGAAGATVLTRRTGAEALAVATTRPPAGTTPPRGNQMAGTRITTIRFTNEQWAWLRRTALERSLAENVRSDASEIIRQLVADAMANGKGARR